MIERLLCWLSLHRWEGGALLYEGDWATRVWIRVKSCVRYRCKAIKVVPAGISDSEARKQLGL